MGLLQTLGLMNQGEASTVRDLAGAVHASQCTFSSLFKYNIDIQYHMYIYTYTIAIKLSIFNLITPLRF